MHTHTHTKYIIYVHIQGEYEIDLITGPLLNLLRFNDLTKSVKELDADSAVSSKLAGKVLEHAQGVMEALVTYSLYSKSHVDGLESVFHGAL